MSRDVLGPLRPHPPPGPTRSRWRAAWAESSGLAVTLALWLGLVAPSGAQAGKADVLRVEAVEEADGEWTFAVTVRHDDAEPDH
jgi:hypothetical protein